jgi:hypothetical protein
MRVPKPTAAFKRHPRLVLYRFDPGPSPAVSGLDAATITSIAVGLRALHGSDVALPHEEDPGGARDRLTLARRRVADRLAASFPDHSARWLAFCDDLEAGATALERFPAMSPTHGSFDLDCVRRSRDRHGDEHCYVYRFDEGRVSHPGFDVGGLLADLDPADSDARELFLATYRQGAAPQWLAALPFFTAAALVFRLDRKLRLEATVRPRELDAFLARCEESFSSEVGR